MTPEQKAAAARDILDRPIFHLLMTELEQTAIDRVVNAEPADHNTRAAYAAEVRAIRNFRDTLNLLAEEANVTGNRAPA